MQGLNLSVMSSDITYSRLGGKGPETSDIQRVTKSRWLGLGQKGKNWALRG